MKQKQNEINEIAKYMFQFISKSHGRKVTKKNGNQYKYEYIYISSVGISFLSGCLLTSNCCILRIVFTLNIFMLFVDL